MSWTIVHTVPGRLRLRPAGPEPPCDSLARVRALPGVQAVRGPSRTRSVVVEYERRSGVERAVWDALGLAQTPAAPPSPASTSSTPARSILDAGRPVVSGINVLMSTSAFAATFLPVPAAMTASLAVASSLPAMTRAARAMSTQHRLTVDSLDAVALGLLLLRRNFRAASMLTGLLAVSQWILDQSVVRTRRSVRELFGTPDRTVRRMEGRTPRRVRINAIQAGELIAVGPGEQVPVDGRVVRGEALVDQHRMTGESLPVERQRRDPVFAGTTVEDGEIVVRAEQIGLDTRLGRIIGAIEAAEGEKPELLVFGEALADRMVSRTFLLGGVGALIARSLDAGIAILVVDYGTSIRVSVPVSALAAIRRGIADGILIKGPRVLERLARVDTVVFDKTGTLTVGLPRVSRAASLAPTLTPEQIVAFAAAAERDVGHPLARAILRHAQEIGVAIPAGSRRESRVGLGTAIVVDGAEVLVGGRRFMLGQGVALDAARTLEAAAHDAGASPTFVAIGRRLSGVLVLEDELRADAPNAIDGLRMRGMREVIMVSGDHPQATRQMADRLGIARHHADLLPEDKAALIQSLRAAGSVVAMVGDGVNDALALQTADVGIAVQGGAEVVTEAASVVLLRGGLDRVARALDLGRQSIRTFRRTVRIALRANLATEALASAGLVGPAGAILLSNGAAVGAALRALVPPERAFGRRPDIPR
jgi:heavy metal translocating P-type ATPase